MRPEHCWRHGSPLCEAGASWETQIWEFELAGVAPERREVVEEHKGSACDASGGEGAAAVLYGGLALDGNDAPSVRDKYAAKNYYKLGPFTQGQPQRTLALEEEGTSTSEAGAQIDWGG
jgi:hypothetical protein